jgi:hypothetical protein
MNWSVPGRCHTRFDNTKKNHRSGITLVLLWTAPLYRCPSATKKELVCVHRTTYEKNMAIGSILVLVLRYIGVELVLYKVVKKGSARHRGGDGGEAIDVKTVRAFPKKTGRNQGGVNERESAR